MPCLGAVGGRRRFVGGVSLTSRASLYIGTCGCRPVRLKSSSMNSSETSAKYSWPRREQKDAIQDSGGPDEVDMLGWWGGGWGQQTGRRAARGRRSVAIAVSMRRVKGAPRRVWMRGAQLRSCEKWDQRLLECDAEKSMGTSSRRGRRHGRSAAAGTLGSKSRR